MPKPYSLDLRERVVKAYNERNESYIDVGARFRIGEATVYRWVTRYHATGSLAPLPHGGGPESIVDEKGLSILCGLVEEHGDATRNELSQDYRELTGVSLSLATVGRKLWQLGYTRKKRLSMLPNVTHPK
jgi:transposase